MAAASPECVTAGHPAVVEGRRYSQRLPARITLIAGKPPVIRMTLAPLPITGAAATSGGRQRDEVICTWDGKEYRAISAHGASMALARQLVAAGCPDQPWEAYTPAGTRSIYGPSLHGLSRLTVEERPKGLRLARYTAYPNTAASVRGSSVGGFQHPARDGVAEEGRSAAPPVAASKGKER